MNRVAIPASFKANLLYRGARTAWHFKQGGHYRRIRQSVRSDTKSFAAYQAAEPAPKLHFGCGENLLPGWLNTDFFPDPPAIPYLDLTGPFPFPNETIELIFSEHVIEHLQLAGGFNMLREAHRVLKSGGRVRISTPSLTALIAIYADPNAADHRRYLEWHRDTWLQSAEIATPAVVFNDFLRNWGHLVVYDPATLLDMLRQVGFADLIECDLQRSGDPRLSGLENDTRMPSGLLALDTMAFEAVKC